MLSALGLLSLVVSCTTEFTPPLLNISLDEAPETRWMPMLKIFDIDFLNAAMTEIIDSTVPKWVHELVAPVVEALEKYVPQPYASEIRGMASHCGATVSDIIVLNFAYEISTFCTSIIAQDTQGNVYHGRNLDFDVQPILRNVTVDVNFIKKGKVVYRGTSFAGYVGLWTGQSPKRFSISGNQRGKKDWWQSWKNVVSGLFLKRSPVSWLIRETLEAEVDFQEAVLRLSNTPIITEVYYIVAGVRPGEGVVITRDRAGPADIWPLDPLNGGWYRVETNFDHWLPSLGWGDDRRDEAAKVLNATGQKNINLATLYQVLSVYPVCNGMTTYTTTMSAATPGEYRSLVRPQGCSNK